MMHKRFLIRGQAKNRSGGGERQREIGRRDMTTLTGQEAIDAAEANGLRLHKYADPTDEAREVTIDEAREIAAVDPSLIWVPDTNPDPRRG